ncbi:Nudix hydrolase 19 [Arachis hypogaea]|nr:Nudix hydrolase 19 [Arachis hypogaea]
MVMVFGGGLKGSMVTVLGSGLKRSMVTVFQKDDLKGSMVTVLVSDLKPSKPLCVVVAVSFFFFFNLLRSSTQSLSTVPFPFLPATTIAEGKNPTIADLNSVSLHSVSQGSSLLLFLLARLAIASIFRVQKQQGLSARVNIFKFSNRVLIPLMLLRGGESLEEAACEKRTWEETDIEVGEVIYHSSQPRLGNGY